MSLSEFQTDVHKWTKNFETQYWPEHEIYTRLGEEFGELADALEGDSNEKIQNIADEITDIMFTVICLANKLGLDLNESWEKMKGQNNIEDLMEKFDKKYTTELEIYARLGVESGKLARAINTKFGHKKAKPGEMTPEIDVQITNIIFTVKCLASKLAIDVDASWEKMKREKFERDKDRYEQKEKS